MTPRGFGTGPIESHTPRAMLDASVHLRPAAARDVVAYLRNARTGDGSRRIRRPRNGTRQSPGM